MAAASYKLQPGLFQKKIKKIKKNLAYVITKPEIALIGINIIHVGCFKG
jgi:hypothetical protein